MILVVISRFNSRITSHLETSAVEALEKAGEEFEVVHVPGAVEIPVVVQKFLRTGKFSAAIALGCVIKGETDHYDFVLRSCIDGLTRVSLDEGVPVVQGVLACPSFSLAWERRNLGKDYSETALEMKQMFRFKSL